MANDGRTHGPPRRLPGARTRLAPAPHAKRHLLSVALTAPILAGLLAFAGPGTVRASDMTVGQSETMVVGLINRDRGAAGLRPVFLDPRLAAIARTRSEDMAARDYFDHVQPDGRSAFTMIDAAGITWYGAGEIIAWNDWADLENSALAADGAWLGSTPHREIMLSPEYNYVGVGLGLSTRGKRLWTAVFLKGPDRTSPWARAYQPVRMATYTSSSTVGLRVTWRGADVPLQVLTSGLRDFQVQRRIDGGTWSYLKTSTTATGLTAGYRLGHRYEFRVRARDNAGNLGSWTAPVSISV